MDNNAIDCHYDIMGINAQFGYNPSQHTIEKDCPKEDLLKEIQRLYFAVNELALYLNTHPTEEKAICLQQEYSTQLKKLTEKYEAVFGPLTIYCPSQKWTWFQNPWSWERSEM